MKASIAALMLTTMAVGVSACGSSSSSSDSGGSTTGSSTTAKVAAAPATIGNCKTTTKPNSVKLDTVSPGTLTVGTVLPLPGYFNGVNPGDVKDGYEYCLAADIANAAGLTKVTVKNVAFEKVIAGNMRGLDVLMAGVFITPEREKVVSFSKPYYTSYSGVLTRSDHLLTQASIRDAKVGVLAGTLTVDYVRNQLKPSGGTSVFQSLADMYVALKAKRIDAAITDTTETLSQQQSSKGAFKVVGQFKVGGANGIVFPKGSSNIAPVNQVIDSLTQDGAINELVKTYLAPKVGGDPETVPFWTP